MYTQGIWERNGMKPSDFFHKGTKYFNSNSTKF